MKIAVLGLGNMGGALSERLLRGGHHVTVWNRSKGRAEPLLDLGATEADSPGEAVTAAEVVITSLANDDAVRAVALEEGGILSAIGDRTYADCSTISPALSAELGDSFVRFVALPILGAPQAVRSGDATYLAGGGSETVDGIRPVLATLSERVKQYPRPAMASSAKLASNLLLLSGIATLAEAFTVARAGGLADEDLTDLFAGSAVVAPGLKNRFEAILEGDGPTWWTTELGAKDLRLAAELVDARGATNLRIAPVVRDAYQAAADAGFRDDDVAYVSRIYR
jgi:3-hydroxyisobutyrate dehydrogenase